jgi:hypothetical protein
VVRLAVTTTSTGNISSNRTFTNSTSPISPNNNPTTPISTPTITLLQFDSLAGWQVGRLGGC